ncbi:SDR family NAD(P)-dependent oxidoreductase [Pseudonocardia sp. NPDC049154]|uniref:SDR family NAD(P)-dependent oxidoreductase n=1 Tax=Pseudonocardia sp. NPDC049154 TaxID=3155501 RepID=UPI0033CDD0B8
MSRRTALVTGASRGIGALIAQRLAADGWDLTLSARSAGPLEALGGRLSAEHGITARAVPADMAAEDDVVALADAHGRASDRLDALVLNAGMGSIGPLAEFPARRLDKLYTVNVRSAYVLTQRLLPVLRKTAGGDVGTAKVIAVSSLTGVAGEPLNSAYGASKAALTSLCETLNTEESHGGVTATAVCVRAQLPASAIAERRARPRPTPSAPRPTAARRAGGPQRARSVRPHRPDLLRPTRVAGRSRARCRPDPCSACRPHVRPRRTSPSTTR